MWIVAKSRMDLNSCLAPNFEWQRQMRWHAFSLLLQIQIHISYMHLAAGIHLACVKHLNSVIAKWCYVFSVVCSVREMKSSYVSAPLSDYFRRFRITDAPSLHSPLDARESFEFESSNRTENRIEMPAVRHHIPLATYWLLIQRWNMRNSNDHQYSERAQWSLKWFASRIELPGR